MFSGLISEWKIQIRLNHFIIPIDFFDFQWVMECSVLLKPDYLWFIQNTYAKSTG